MSPGETRILVRAARLLTFAGLVALPVAARASSIPLTINPPNSHGSDDANAEALQSTAMANGFAAIARKDYEAAIDAFTQAIRSGYHPEVGYVERATAYEYSGNHDQAIADSGVALQLDPKFGGAWTIRGTFEYMTHDYAHAVDDETEALRLNPGNQMAQYERGLNEVAAGDYDKAITDFNQVLQAAAGGNAPPPSPNGDTSTNYGLVIIETDGMKPNFFRGLAYLKKGELDKAEDDFTAALKIDPKNIDALARRGATRLHEGRRDLGMDDFAQALALSPQNAELYNQRGVALLDAHDFKSALADFSTALQIDPNHAPSLNNLGLAYLDTGDPDRAIDAFTRALEIDPTLALAYCNRANAFTARGRLDAAVADLNQALALDPKSPPIQSDLALAYTKMGDYGKAIASFEQALALDPGFGGAYNNLAWLLATCPDAKFRDGRRALAAATMACKFSDWKDPVSLDTFAAACAESGDFDAAVKWEQNAIAAPGMSPGDIADARKRIALYQAHKTYQEDPRAP